MKSLFLTILLLFLATPVDARVPSDPALEQWAYTDIGAYEAWDLAIGSRDIVVAIIDNGFDTFHPDLLQNAWKNEDEIANNGIDDDNNGYIDDVWGWNFVYHDTNKDGTFSELEKVGNNDPRPDVSVLSDGDRIHGIYNHGSLVAGIIGAVGNNNKDTAGINWNVRLMNLKAISNGGSGHFGPVVDAIYYAVDNGADVINISIVGNGNDELTQAINFAYDHGVAIIAAAGNERIDLNLHPQYPVCSDEGEGTEKILGVSSIGEAHHLSTFSNAGSNCIDITAPGENILSTTRYSPKDELQDRVSGGWNGTSFAAPFVSGAAALVKSIQPTWSVDQIYTALLSTVHRTPGQDDTIYNGLFGAGLLQVDKAVAYAFERLTNGAIVFFDRESRQIVERTIQSAEEKVRAPRAVQSADSVASFLFDSNKRWYVTTEQQLDKTTIRVFSHNWRKQHEWTLDATDLYLVVGNVTGESDAEIILTSAQFSDELFRVYTLGGDLLSSYAAPTPQTGATLTTVKRSPYADLIVLSEHEDGLTLTHLNGAEDVLRTFPVTLLYEPGPIAVGDIDGDGTSEYILAGPAGSNPFLVYLNEQGKGKRRFYPYGQGYQEGFSVVVNNYTPSAGAEVLTIPTTNAFPMRSWSDRGKILDEWTLQEGKDIKQLQLAQ